jgi:capsular exopolysaccharide synthesis family protein
MLLTSAGPREGKTTTALNLATVLAFSGARTLIIDADLRKPRAHVSFGLPNKKGLTNLIVGEDDPYEYCQRTSIERVDVLTSGPIPPNPSELLGRPRMREILRKLRDRYDQIIVDTPPIGAVTDAAVLATMVDGVILVVHAGKTRRQIVSRGIEQLRYINAPIIGVILNNLKLGRGRYYPGYYHYYYYYTSHYGAEDGDSKKKPDKKGARVAETAPEAVPDAPVGGDSAAD